MEIYLNVPLTGTVISGNPVLGDKDDCIRLIEIDLGNVGWELVDLDLDNDMARIRVRPATSKCVLKPGGNPANPDDIDCVRLTEADQIQLLNDAKARVEKTKDELYSLSGSMRLKKTAKVMADYQAGRG